MKKYKIVIIALFALIIGAVLAEIYIRTNCVAFVDRVCVPYRNDMQRYGTYESIK